jgi:hypothetical protein
MKKMVLTALFAVTSLAVVPAFADDAKGHRPSFPMPAATFQQHVQGRIVKMREHTEKRASTLPADQAKELRAKTEAAIVQMNAEVQKAVADGTVTAEEAKAVRAAAPHGKGGHCEGKDKAGAKT